jgi:cellobiose-specific phosphotransferase system component IIA
MDDTQTAVVKTAFAFAGISAGIAKMLGALNKVNAGQHAEASEAIADAVAALQKAEPQIREMLEAVQRIAVA